MLQETVEELVDLLGRRRYPFVPPQTQFPISPPSPVGSQLGQDVVATLTGSFLVSARPDSV